MGPSRCSKVCPSRCSNKAANKEHYLCKSVCKVWYSLISDPEFAKLYLAQAEACPQLGPTWVSRTLYLVEPEDSSDFDLKDSACDYGTSRCIQFHLQMNFHKCKIWLRNAEQATNAMLNRKRTTKRKPPPAAHETDINAWVMEDYGAQKPWIIHNLKQ
ncbi:unnamed protein product [Prunus armeniaca]|uniref:F-box domain-containing protein n=1 Tax=Prunus armeniaca TaxID=36596 RepID=A0A6J5WTI5_PRUAR|nr:unnamed protein product [Prunus armeniaca]